MTYLLAAICMGVCLACATVGSVFHVVAPQAVGFSLAGLFALVMFK